MMVTKQKKTSILIVDDEPSLREVLCQLLESEGYRISQAASAEEAMALMRDGPFSVVITDIILGGMSGIDLLKEVKKIHPETEVIIMTCYASLETATQATRYGAVDYILKNFEDLDLILSVVKCAVLKYNESEEERQAIRDLRRYHDELKETNRTQKELTHQDELTGLYNDLYFEEALEREVVRSKEHNRTFSVIILEMDRFSECRDSHGLSAANSFLCKLSDLLKKRHRQTDLMVRWEQERFCILLPETDQSGATNFARSVHKMISECSCSEKDNPSFWNAPVNIGISTFPDNGCDIKGLFEHACKQLADPSVYQVEQEKEVL